jgi:hypothetical protein
MCIKLFNLVINQMIFFKNLQFLHWVKYFSPNIFLNLEVLTGCTEKHMEKGRCRNQSKKSASLYIIKALVNFWYASPIYANLQMMSSLRIHFFYGTGVWTQGLTLARQEPYYLSHSVRPFSGILKQKIQFLSI